MRRLGPSNPARRGAGDEAGAVSPLGVHRIVGATADGDDAVFVPPIAGDRRLAEMTQNTQPPKAGLAGLTAHHVGRFPTHKPTSVSRTSPSPIAPPLRPPPTVRSRNGPGGGAHGERACVHD